MQSQICRKNSFLDLTKTEFVENFTWSNTTYPGSTNPNLNGKPVLVLALKDEDENVAYSFINLEDLIDVYTGTDPITIFWKQYFTCKTAGQRQEPTEENKA